MAKRKREENLVQIIRDYSEKHPDETPTMREICEWAMSRGLMDEPDVQLLREQELQRRSKELAEVARKEHHVDPDGKIVRSFYCVTALKEDECGKLRQQGLWSPREMATWEFKTEAITQRYQQVRGDAVALQTDVTSVNRHDRPKGKPVIQLNWDLTDAFGANDEDADAG